jgi:AcrR family transcriptional regulator
MPLAARQGLAELSLEDLAARAGVTRNLVYHYFPRGRPDVALAVVEEAERQLAPREDGRTGLAAIVDHALAPTHAWRIHRMAAAETDPALRAATARMTAALAESLAITPSGTAGPRPMADAAMHGCVGFAEAALDRGRALGLSRAELVQLLDEMLVAALGAAQR